MRIKTSVSLPKLTTVMKVIEPFQRAPKPTTYLELGRAARRLAAEKAKAASEVPERILVFPKPPPLPEEKPEMTYYQLFKMQVANGERLPYIVRTLRFEPLVPSLKHEHVGITVPSHFVGRKKPKQPIIIDISDEPDVEVFTGLHDRRARRTYSASSAMDFTDMTNSGDWVRYIPPPIDPYNQFELPFVPLKRAFQPVRPFLIEYFPDNFQD